MFSFKLINTFLRIRNKRSKSCAKKFDICSGGATKTKLQRNLELFCFYQYSSGLYQPRQTHVQVFAAENY